ncbi:MAG: hypothetical protein NVS2B16_05430 [Chloroflexota bacterium]
MVMLVTTAPVELLEERLVRGAELLFDMERRGEMGQQYTEWLHRWESLLVEYEVAVRA